MSTARADTGERWLRMSFHFSERRRVGRHLLADALLDLLGERAIESCVLLRGIEGFGGAHHLRTDRLLTLSEDLPVVALAHDTPERIEALLPELQRLGGGRGLLTLSTVEAFGAEAFPEAARAADMAGGGEALARLAIHIGRHQRKNGQPAFVAACDLLHRRGVAGATVLLGVDGTRHGERRRARFIGRNADVPMMIVAVAARAQLEAVLPELAPLLTDPLFTLEALQVCKRDGQLLERPHTQPAGSGDLLQLVVVTSEVARHGRRPIQHELVRRLRERGTPGATSLRGIWGFHGDHASHGDRLLSLRRHVPVLTSIAAPPEQIEPIFAVVDELTDRSGLVTCESTSSPHPPLYD